MIAALFRSKFGIVVMAGLVCGVFFTLSKLKHRRADQAEAQSTIALSASPGNKTGGAEQAALLKRTQETTRGRAETLRMEKANERTSGSSYDEAGNVYRRRATPEPISQPLRAAPEQQTSEAPREPMIVPTLRIRGRTAAAPDAIESSNPFKNPFEKLLSPLSVGPHANSLPSKNEAASSLATPPAKPKPDRFVPFGRLIKAELVITLESTEDEMPLIALITEPVYNNGRLVIPAGTELHSMARPDRIRDRIISTTIWRLVFPREGNKPNGRQLTFDGIALDRDDRDGNGLTWGITDGSYGMRGRAIKNGQGQEEIMLFAAEALRAFGGTLSERQQTIVGAETQANARNAGIAGGQAVLEQFARKISKEIDRNGVYIQVPAGKQFYVYPRQVIDPDRADISENIAGVE